MAIKKNTVPISSMEDLVNLINHNVEVLDRRTRKLAKSSRSLRVLCMFAIGYAIYAAVENRKQEEKIYQLSVRVKKLERDEGE